jgi:aryl-phospho-beta-D-glucosidase BglC (GH1 family)
MAEILGEREAEFFFDRFLDHFFAEEDVAFLKSLGANVVRLPLNYRHFENDAAPFRYLEKGFARLDQALSWCAQHGLYAILDLHAVQGWQNPAWHCDNSSRHTYFWTHRHFQDRFIALWEEFARRYKGNPVVAGYDLMNEPVTNAPFGRFSFDYTADYAALDRIYRRAVAAIRALDPEHIIFLEGDLTARVFDGMDVPCAENLVYSSHNYTDVGFGPGPYPGVLQRAYYDRGKQGEYYDAEKQWEDFERFSGTRFARKHNVPLWIGEFGSAYNGPKEEIPDRLRALDDQIGVFEAFGAHWTIWTYKDVYVMGLLQPASDSSYIQTTRTALGAKRALATDFWMNWVPPTPVVQQVNELARQIEAAIGDPRIDPRANERFLGQSTLTNYVGLLMQPAYARCFAQMSETEIDRVLQSWSFKNCVPHQGLIEVLKKNMARPAAE